jgi:hypothetical protein
MELAMGVVIVGVALDAAAALVLVAVRRSRRSGSARKE